MLNLFEIKFGIKDRSSKLKLVELYCVKIGSEGQPALMSDIALGHLTKRVIVYSSFLQMKERRKYWHSSIILFIGRAKTPTTAY
jgi:hypothetical protein